MATAFPDALEIAFREQPDGRECDRTQRGFDGRQAQAPQPAVRGDARRKLGLGDKSRVKGRQTGERRFVWPGAMPERGANIVDRLAKLGRSPQKIRSPSFPKTFVELWINAS